MKNVITYALLVPGILLLVYLSLMTICMFFMLSYLGLTYLGYTSEWFEQVLTLAASWITFITERQLAMWMIAGFIGILLAGLISAKDIDEQIAKSKKRF